MELEYTKDSIRLNKELSSLDEFTLSFVKILDKLNLKYVLVSGYVSILFGRSRSSEDVDIILERIPFNRFFTLWDELKKDFVCISADDPKDAYNNYLNDKISIRFATEGKFIPNMEIKFPNIELQSWAIAHRIKVVLNNVTLYISPLEQQISYKLYLGSLKDIEDAKHLYRIFKDKLNMALLYEFNTKLKVDKDFSQYLK